MALTLRRGLWGAACRSRGFRCRRLVHRVIRKLQRGANDVGDEVSILIASGAGLDTLKQRHALLWAQVEAEKVCEPFEPLKHRGGHRSLERAHRLRLGV